MDKHERAARFMENGYNPIHLIGDLYLIRRHSKYTHTFSVYVLKIIRDL